MKRSRAYKRKKIATVCTVIFAALIIAAMVILIVKVLPGNGNGEAEAQTSSENPFETFATEETIPVVTEPPIRDVTAPVIDGAADITVTEGDTVAYKSGITVTDDMDPSPALSVDASAVDLNAPGTYQVIYSAQDASGNVSQVTVNVNVEAKVVGEENYDELLRLAKNAVNDCVDKSGSEAEQIYDAFWWIKCEMKFTGDSEKTSWINEGIRGFKEHYGDCFTYFAMMKAMLTVMGYETIDVTRLGGDSHHYWSLVKYHDQWYHIDACPRAVEKDKYWYCFLRTDEELLKWNSHWSPDDEAYGYYNYDASLYPESGKDPLKLGWMQNH